MARDRRDQWDVGRGDGVSRTPLCMNHAQRCSSRLWLTWKLVCRYRWVVHNSALDASLGDGIVIGASSIEQWENNLAAIQKGPLSAETAAKIDALWTADVKANAVFDNWQAMGQIMSARK